MPNWCEGSLKLRGKYPDILRFFEEGVCAYKSAQKPGEDPIPIESSEWIEIEEYNDSTDIAWYKLPVFAWLYIEGTRRAFIETDHFDKVSILYDSKDKSKAIVAIPIKQAWGFDQGEWSELAKKYNLHLKLFGIKQGMGFMQEYQVTSDGGVLQDICTNFGSYSEFVWNCPLPWMGG